MLQQGCVIVSLSVTVTIDTDGQCSLEPRVHTYAGLQWLS